MKSFAFLSVLLSFATGQKYGVGFGKTTFSTTDGVAVYDFMMANLPIVKDYPNGPRPCGDVGRARIATTSFPAPFSDGFGIHAVHVNSSSSRIHPECIDTEEVERALDAKMEEVHIGGHYDAFMDFNSGHWVSSLDPYVALYQNTSIPFSSLSWEDAINQRRYFSVIIRLRPSMMFVELMSDDCSACLGLAKQAGTARYFFAEGKGPEDLFGSLSDKSSRLPLMHPAKISWPTSDAAREQQYLGDGLGAILTSHKTADSVQTDVYDFTPVMAKTAPMQFHVVQRPANASTGSMSWEDFEVALTKCHKASIQDDLCGENPWMDHHMGFGIHGDNAVHTDAQKLKELATKLSLPFHVTPSNGGGVAVYVIGGNGLSITFQVEQGSYEPPRAMGSGMLDLCGDGTCASGLITPLQF